MKGKVGIQMFHTHQRFFALTQKSLTL